MSDIVERLKNGAPVYDDHDNPDAMALDWWEDEIGPEAIDEITHLREANKKLYDALSAAVSAGMVPKSSAKEGGASAYSEQVRVADMIRAALGKHKCGVK